MTEQERIAALSEPWKSRAEYLMSIRPEELPQNPEKNKWYVYRPEGCISSTGTPYFSTMRIGTENKLMVLFCGGGAAIDAYAAARPNFIPPVEGEAGFYAAETFLVGYFEGHGAIADMKREDNPFRDWSIVVVSYASGDFHCGRNDFMFDDPEKGKGVCHHRGYYNYRAMVEKMKEFVPNPEKLLVTGYSAGGFGTAILTDDVISLFPHCKDVTCLVDSGVFAYDGWHETAEKQWKAPEEIVSRVRSDNIALDCLLALHRDHGDVKIALACSYRDALLAQCEGYAHGQGKLVFSKENGDAFQATLSKTVKTLQEEIPGVALYIFDKPSTEPGVKEEHGLTEHTFLDYQYLYDYSFGGVKALDWIVDCVNGKMRKVGLELLGLQ